MMTLPAVNGLEPLAVWDCNDSGSIYWRFLVRASKWAMEHIPDAFSTYRLDFYLLDAPFAVVYRVARDAGGAMYADPETGEMAVEPPVVQLLTELPPAALLGR